jgi:hypothetical protein
MFLLVVSWSNSGTVGAIAVLFTKILHSRCFFWLSRGLNSGTVGAAAYCGLTSSDGIYTVTL